MGEIVNLRRARKGRAREEAASRAAANRRKFGATLAEREALRAERALEVRRLDAHQRDGASASDGAQRDCGPSGRSGDGE